MTKKTLSNLLKIGEGLTLEFKRSASSLGREICALANASGGKILVGVDDDGSVIGISKLNRTKSEIQSIARNMDPSLVLDIEAVNSVLVVSVPSGSNKPYSVNGKFYIREAANSQQMKRAEIREFFFKEGLIRFDEQICRKFAMSRDFSARRFSSFMRAAGIPSGLKREDVLRNLQVVHKGGMTNAGVLLFSRKPSKFFLCAKTNCALFQGTGKTTILDQQIYEGGILDVYENAIKYLKTHLNAEYVIKGGPREEILELPEDALREAVLNAIAHRDYRSTGHVQIQVFHDRVEIVNPGGLVAGLKPKDLGRVSLPRNPLLFALMHRMDLVEHVGSGIKRIRDEMKRYGLKEPLIESGEVWFSVTLWRKPQHSSIQDLKATKRGRELQKGSQKGSQKSSQKSSQKILGLLAQDPHLTIRELAERIGITDRAVKKNIAQLQKQGVLRRVGSDRSGHWEVIGP